MYLNGNIGSSRFAEHLCPGLSRMRLERQDFPSLLVSWKVILFPSRERIFASEYSSKSSDQRSMSFVISNTLP